MQLLTNYDRTEDSFWNNDANDPFVLFHQWLKDAESSELNDPNAMALATASTDGLPDVRIVLLKDFDTNGFVFFTNTQSQKGAQLHANMQAVAVLYWKSLGRQVRFRGPVEFISDAEADAYFSSRPRDSRIGAWASQQSRPLKNRFDLKKAVEHEATRFALVDVPRPPYGPVIASGQFLWSSGQASHFVCMIGLFSKERSRKAVGARDGSIHRVIGNVLCRVSKLKEIT